MSLLAPVPLSCCLAAGLSLPVVAIAQDQMSQPGYEKFDAERSIVKRHFSGDLELRGKSLTEALTLLMQQHFLCGIGSDEIPGFDPERWGSPRKIACVQRPSFDEANCRGLRLSVRGSWPVSNLSPEQIYDQLETSIVKGYNVTCPWPQMVSLQSLMIERPKAEVKFAASIERLMLAGRSAREAYGHFMKDCFNCGLQVEEGAATAGQSPQLVCARTPSRIAGCWEGRVTMTVQWPDPAKISSNVFHQMDTARISTIKTECAIPNDLEDSNKSLKG
ncbi:hypothetical protein SAMN05518854_1231 [Variovorax sp. YR266]|uniref:hypothetical protein n=1 Tax=Variovorax sp. YR266 TaxID=1884386 RepID=UPI00089CAC9A|nr:hypothetical protein [Variovorax sp. YR266]SDZ72122.1 hypothetical protein SAMN05518854_1231 [Variovorax sp. YR266]